MEDPNKAFMLGSNEGPAVSTNQIIEIPTMTNQPNTPLKPDEVQELLHVTMRSNISMKKEIETLNTYLDEATNNHHALQSRIAELERGNVAFETSHKQTGDLMHELHKKLLNERQLNKTLMGLLEEAFKEGLRLHYLHPDAMIGVDEMGPLIESDWQNYCKFHNLTP